MLRSFIPKCVPATAAVLLASSLQAAEPAWWVQRGVIAKDTSNNRLPASDYSAVNQGQLKNFVAAAAAELDANLRGGSGDELGDLLASWNVPNPNRSDFAAANIGQAKALAAMVYDRLIAESAAGAYPWAQAPNPAADFAMINIGQLKALFAFEVDSDGDGLPDFWELKYFGNLERDGSGHFDADGLTDLQEYQLSSNPTSVDTDGDGMKDGWEVAHGFNLIDPSDASGDDDGDGWTNMEEFLAGTDPGIPNTTLPVVSIETFTYDPADRLNAIAAPAAATLGLDPENNVLSSQ